MRAERARVTVAGRHVETLTWAPPPVGTTRIHRPGERPGAHLVFLHGWGLTPRTYAPGLRRLAGAGHQVTAISLPGFGRSEPLHPRRQTLTGISEHLAATVELLTTRGDLPEDIHLVGHSFGGGLALRLGATLSRPARSLTLVCPVGGAAVPVAAASMAAGLCRDVAAPWVLRAALDVTRNLTRHPLAASLSGLAAWQADLLDDVDAISGRGIATLMSFASADTVVSRGTFHERVLPHLKVELVPGRHSWLLDQPARFAEKVTNHLHDVATAAPTAAAPTAGGAPAA